MSLTSMIARSVAILILPEGIIAYITPSKRYPSKEITITDIKVPDIIGVIISFCY